MSAEAVTTTKVVVYWCKFHFSSLAINQLIHFAGGLTALTRPATQNQLRRSVQALDQLSCFYSALYFGARTFC